MDAWDVRIAPDATRVAVTRVDPQLGTLDIWTYDGDAAAAAAHLAGHRRR